MPSISGLLQCNQKQTKVSVKKWNAGNLSRNLLLLFHSHFCSGEILNRLLRDIIQFYFNENNGDPLINLSRSWFYADAFKMR